MKKKPLFVIRSEMNWKTWVDLVRIVATKSCEKCLFYCPFLISMTIFTIQNFPNGWLLKSLRVHSKILKKKYLGGLT